MESGISKFILDREGARFALQYSKLLCISSIPNKGKKGSVFNHIRGVFALDIIKMSLCIFLANVLPLDDGNKQRRCGRMNEWCFHWCFDFDYFEQCVHI